ncbi:MAG: hypothetical protein WC797_02340 [Candidatus Paceibacterota bacterium]|jgi:hypothetical protein
MTLSVQDWAKIGLWGTVIFTFVEAYGAWKQREEIVENKSGESVAVIWVTYFSALYAVVIFYGLSILDPALIFNGVFLTPFNFLLCRDLYRHKKFSLTEMRLCKFFGLIILASAILPYRDWVFVLFTLGNIAFSFTQPYEIWKNGRGVVSILALSCYLSSTIFWNIYAFNASNPELWTLKIICPFYAIALGLAVLFWFVFPKKKEGGNDSV